MNLDQWFAKYSHGRTLINRGGTQCVAVANAFEAEFVQGIGDEWIGTPLTGWANDWWDNFGRDVDYNEYIKVGAAERAQKGDVAIWHRYGGGGLPHIAIVHSDQNGGLYCLTQNPGPAHMEQLTKRGLTGYLRPKKLIVSTPGKTNEQVAAEVLRGEWGNGDDRKARLASAGYDYGTIQAIVNGQAKPAPAAASLDQIAQAVIRGEWGNGQDRKNRLAAAGYDPNAVQAIVNRQLA